MNGIRTHVDVFTCACCIFDIDSFKLSTLGGQPIRLTANQRMFSADSLNFRAPIQFERMCGNGGGNNDNNDHDVDGNHWAIQFPKCSPSHFALFVAFICVCIVTKVFLEIWSKNLIDTSFARLAENEWKSYTQRMNKEVTHSTPMK